MSPPRQPDAECLYCNPGKLSCVPTGVICSSTTATRQSTVFSFQMAFLCLQGLIHKPLPFLVFWFHLSYAASRKHHHLLSSARIVGWRWKVIVYLRLEGCISTQRLGGVLCLSLPGSLVHLTHCREGSCVCSGGRAPQQPSRGFFTIYVTAAVRAAGCLFTLLSSCSYCRLPSKASKKICSGQWFNHTLSYFINAGTNGGQKILGFRWSSNSCCVMCSSNFYFYKTWSVLYKTKKDRDIVKQK